MQNAEASIESEGPMLAANCPELAWRVFMINLDHSRSWAPAIRVHPSLVLVSNLGLKVCNTLKQMLTRTSQALCLVVPVIIAVSAPCQECVFGFNPGPPASVTATQGSLTFLFCPITNNLTTNCAPFRYQWRYNGTNLQTATNQIIAFVNIQPVLAGVYDMVATAFSGSAATSSPCLLRVQPLLRNVSLSNQILGFSFDSNAGRTNVAEWTTDLETNAGPSWTVVLSVLGDGSTVRVSEAALLGQGRFYRVRIE